MLFHRNVQVIDVLLTRIVLEIGGATGSFIVLSLFFIFIGWMPVPVDLLQVVFGWVMLAWFGASLALLIGAGAAFSPIVERLWHPAAYLLFPLSGAAFMVDWMPANLQQVVLLLPMVHGVEILREGYFGNVVRTHYDIGYMAVCCLVLSLGGSVPGARGQHPGRVLMLSIEHVSKVYSTRQGPRRVLDDVNFQLERGRNLGHSRAQWRRQIDPDTPDKRGRTADIRAHPPWYACFVAAGVRRRLPDPSYWPG